MKGVMGDRSICQVERLSALWLWTYSLDVESAEVTWKHHFSSLWTIKHGLIVGSWRFSSVVSLDPCGFLFYSGIEQSSDRTKGKVLQTESCALNGLFESWYVRLWRRKYYSESNSAVTWFRLSSRLTRAKMVLSTVSLCPFWCSLPSQRLWTALVKFSPVKTRDDAFDS